jgi:hypothetical protein
MSPVSCPIPAIRVIRPQPMPTKPRLRVSLALGRSACSRLIARLPYPTRANTMPVTIRIIPLPSDQARFGAEPFMNFMTWSVMVWTIASIGSPPVGGVTYFDSAGTAACWNLAGMNA